MLVDQKSCKFIKEKIMVRGYALFFLMIAGILPSCRKKEEVPESREEQRKYAHQEELAHNQVNIPVATNDFVALGDDSGLLGFFDEDDDYTGFEIDNEHMVDAQDSEDQDFSWVDTAQEVPENMKTVYFDFDRYEIREDQKNAVSRNAAYIKETFDVAQSEGKNSVIVAEGHADLFGNESYNIALSEKRAASVAQELVALGVPQENIKVVGRGQSVPVIVDGKKITGSRDEQWPHRRVECRVIVS